MLAANQNEKRQIKYFLATLENKGDWNVTRRKPEDKWAKLMDDDLQYAKAGRTNEPSGCGSARAKRLNAIGRESCEPILGTL